MFTVLDVVSDSDTEEIKIETSGLVLPTWDQQSRLGSEASPAKRQKQSQATPIPPPQGSTPRASVRPWPLVMLPPDPVRVRENGGEKNVPDTELPKCAPATLIRRVLRQELADRLLAQLLSEAVSWESQDWVVHGQHQMTPRTTAEYWLRPEHAPQDAPRCCGIPSADMREAAQALEEVVRHCRPRSRWSPSYALANCYRSGRDTVGFHSDFLSTLGPRPIIVGLSLGATRLFRLRRASKTITIPMPHNSAVVMWDDCQEEWQHSVPRQADSVIDTHRTAGRTRISLTFRMARPELASRRVNCKCGRSTVLKCKSGKYYLACSPMTTKQCGFWTPCAWAEEEAARMREELRETEPQNHVERSQARGGTPKQKWSTLGVASGALERPLIDLT